MRIGSKRDITTLLRFIEQCSKVVFIIALYAY